MKLAVMQPYLFPYIGYFQLIYAADLFLIYDDVAYIKQGYINRNSILSPNGATRFTIPVPGASSNKLISELAFSEDVAKVLRTIEQSYSKAPYFEEVFPMIRGALELGDRSIASVCQRSFEDIFSYLGLKKQFKKTSELEYNRSASARDRLIALCQQFGADSYINAPGGRKLYAKQDFAEKGIDLKFVDSLLVEYSQGGDEFAPNLSIIDMLMNCSPSQVIENMERYELS
ncbi:WbqC family protein [Idiomarina abyssalis]|uniref:WbqC family protein n=1 Tax=Idiomarina abyssalis TaxID=86102 RepID=A0A8I1G2T4_9GAMM|nr:WbqC family protein [Idiomarina abyssalis]MBJ7265753.1 WbqC family protein [Idiomarina abyssalis]MBJ7274006.1 WbqC family protein [Idiomarina abyssalis]MBJ7314888.1 WbqC family protein [Idiomarina abyssalis]